MDSFLLEQVVCETDLCISGAGCTANVQHQKTKNESFHK